MSIKMKALRSFTGASEGHHVKRGREFTARDERRAKELEAHGLAYRVDIRAEPAPLNKMEPPPQNKAAEAGPLDSAGGATGAEAPAPSLPLDPPPRKRRSRRSRDASASSR